MQEYEDRKKEDICGNCQHFESREGNKGVCALLAANKNRYDTRTNWDNWCQHFKKVTAMDTENTAPSAAEKPKGSATEELTTLMNDLVAFKETLGPQLTKAVEADNLMLLFETKGMISTLGIIINGIKARLTVLNPPVGK